MTTKKVLSALERVYAAEIEARLPFQSKAAIFQTLSEDGLIEPMERSFGVATMKGWQLTHAGRMLYCMSCVDEH